MKALLLKLHRWLGLGAGAVLVVVCLTGAILVFEPQVTHHEHPERYQVTVPAGAAPIDLDRAAAVARAASPGVAIVGANIFSDPARPYQFVSPDSAVTYVNPYTGTVIAAAVHRSAFFAATEHLHKRLLDDEPGEWLVLGSTIAMLAILLFGIVLWWPATPAALRARTTVAKIFGRAVAWKRRNYDLHVVIGIYSLPVLFVLGCTGVMFDADWFDAGVNAVTGNHPASLPSGSPLAAGTLPSFAAAYRAARGAVGSARWYEVRLPADSTPTAPVVVRSLANDAPRVTAVDLTYLDASSMAPLRTDRYRDAGAAAHIRSTFRPLHVGTIGGLPTQVIAFLVCILGVIFPITGVLMWYPRWNRQRRRQSIADIVAVVPSVLEESGSETPGP